MVPITTISGDEYAFVPAALPPSEGALDPKLWPLVTKATGEVLRLDGIGRTLPSPTLLLRPLQRREALRSSRIEGTVVSPEQLLLYEALDGFESEPKGRQEQDWLEVFAYYKALRAGFRIYRRDGARLDRETMKTLHRILMDTSPRGRDKRPGHFRGVQNHVVGEAGRFTPPPVADLDGCLVNLEEFLAGEHDPGGLLGQALVRAYVAHYQFEAIHPFEDGNGRVGRLLLALTTTAWLNLSKPWLYMSEFFDENRSQYIERLFRVSTHGEWSEWIEFCLEGTKQQAEAAIRTCDALWKVRAHYLATAGSMSPRMHQIITMLFSNPILSIPDIQRRCDVHYVTAKGDVDKLVEIGVLTEVGRSRPRAFAASELLRVAYIS
ncbi:MAG: Fic family protein [Phycisphaerales bacterium]|nr:Fic family protein [Phycisphaerales bacterium]